MPRADDMTIVRAQVLRFGLDLIRGDGRCLKRYVMICEYEAAAENT